MSLYAGLDMSVKTTALCVVNATVKSYSRWWSIAHRT